MKTQPLEHQNKILPTLATKDSYAFLWEMGLGKTWIGCYLIEKEYFRNNSNKKILILCPNSVVDVWYKELLLHTEIPEDSITILQGSKAKRIDLLRKHQICILNYEGIQVIEEELQKYIFAVLIADESQKIKNPKAIRTRLAIKLKGTKRYIMSGTPISKDYMDVFSQWLFLDGGKTFGTSFYAFRTRYFQDANAARYKGGFPEWKVKSASEKDLNDALTMSAHRLEKKDVLTLPEKIRALKYCELTPEQRKMYKELKDECISYLTNEVAVTAQVALTKLIRLTQITSGFVKGVDENIFRFDKNPKLELCKELVEEILERPENKVIIWARYRYDIEILMKTYPTASVIYGDIKDRGEQVRRFQEDSDCRIFIAQFQSASEGITLTKANYAIRYSYNYNYLDWRQAEDRCHRKGSEIHKNITYIDLAAKDTIDEAILGSLDSKNTSASEILDAIKRGI